MPNHREYIQEVRDALYGFVYLNKAEWTVINSPAFQRLRDIKQLAMGHMVYPGAVHTRFEHSIGCVHQADRLIHQMRESSREVMESEFRITPANFERARQILRLAALLHDVGHPPYSHSGEHLLPTVGDVHLTHEDMTARIIRETEIGEKIEHWFGSDGIDREDVIAVATSPSKAKGKKATAYISILNEILTGDLGADRIDYLLRDAYHAGQRSGAFDQDRLIREVRLVSMPREQDNDAPTNFHLGFGEGGWGVAEQMIAARYLMYTGLYFHKTKRIFEIHLTDFMPSVLHATGGHLPAAVTEYISLSDSKVWADISQAAVSLDHPMHALAKRFVSRDHMRRALELVLADNFLETAPGKPRSRKVPDSKRFKRLAASVRDKYGDRIVTDSPDHSATKMFDANKLLVELDGVTRSLDDVSEVVGGMSSRIWRGRIYADNSIRTEVEKFCRKWLEENPMVKAEEGAA